MIKANELRIGNWIMDRGNKMWAINCWESANKVAAKSPLLGEHPIHGETFGHPLTEYIQYLQPIPLTPEILEKCGFEWETQKKTHLEHEIIEGHVLSFYYDNGQLDQVQFYDCDSLNFCSFPAYNMKYVHQLQNLYWCLCGEELEINL